MIRTVLVLPQPLALLEPCSVEDPVSELRAACQAALSALPDSDRLVVLAAPTSAASRARGMVEPLGHRVARHLLRGVPFEATTALPETAVALRDQPQETTLVVMADGTARRDEKAPGHFHPGARDFDQGIDTALRTGNARMLAALDPVFATELWCEGVPGFQVLGELARDREVTSQVSYAEAPFGVAWWVARWDLSSVTGSAQPGELEGLLARGFGADRGEPQ